MRILWCSLAFFLGFSSLALQGEQLPPLGKRVYLLDSKRAAWPADIKPTQQHLPSSGQNMMRDPLPIGTKDFRKTSAHLRPAEAPKRISRIVFDKVSVQGRYLVPRVIFDRSSLGIGREEPPIQVEYKKKILESERELREFDW